MAKSKSSASSATRKKHAAKAASKAAGGRLDGDDIAPASEQPAQRGQKKAKKDRFAPKIKSYVPPPPPPRGAPDPVDVYLNAGAGVDAELVVVLRRLAKRDEATLQKGVDGLETWIRDLIGEESALGRMSEDERAEVEWKVEQRREEAINALAVWAHHFPRLALHPSRRLRLATHSLHSQLTAKPSPTRPSRLIAEARAALLAPLWTEQIDYVGAWSCAAFDGDRAVRSAARRSWDQVVVLGAPKAGNADAESSPSAVVEGIVLAEQGESILQFATSLVLAPPATNSNSDSLEDPSLLKMQALLTISYLLSTLPAPLLLSEDALAVLGSAELWDLVSQDQPAQLRRALYEVLGSAVARSEAELVGGERVRTISERVLVHCWMEDEGWAGVIAFLRRYPQAWTLADESLADEHSAHHSPDVSEDDDESDGEVKQKATPKAAAPPAVPSSNLFTPSPTLSLLLQHLTLACSGHPASYQTIILLLSTIPPAILPASLPAMSLLFESFWAAWGGRALSIGSIASIGAGPSAAEEFVASLLECLLWEVARVEKEGKAEWAQELVDEWVGRVFKTYLGRGDDGAKRHRGIVTARVAALIEGTLTKLATRSQAYFDGPWKLVEQESLASFAETDTAAVAGSLPPLAAALIALGRSKSERVQSSARALAVQSVLAAANGITQQSTPATTSDLFAFLKDCRSFIAGDGDVGKALDELATTQVPALLAKSSSLAPLSFLSDQLTAASAESRTQIWTSLFRSSPSQTVLLSLIEAVSFGSLPADLPSAELDDLAREATQRALGDAEATAVDLQIVSQLIVQPQPFIAATTPVELLELICSKLVELVEGALGSEGSPQLELLTPPARILAHFTMVQGNAKLLAAKTEAALAVFELAHVLPNCRLAQDGFYLPVEATSAAEQVWRNLLAVNGDVLTEATLVRLASRLTETVIRPSPIEIVTVAASLPSVALTDLLLTRAAFNALFGSIKLSQPSAALAVNSPLVSQSAEEDDSVRAYPDVDTASLSAYARAVVALLDISARDTRWVRRNLWVLPHVLLAGDVARDELAVAGSTSSLFGRRTPEEVLTRLVSAADGLASYLLSSAANELTEGWHNAAVLHLRSKEAPPTAPDDIAVVLDGLARRGRDADDVYARRAFCTVLQATLRYADGTVSDAERWLAWGQNLPEGSELTRAVVLAVKGVLLETPRYERYQNELASIISGVPSSAVNTRGLGLLRVLLASAPSPDAPVIFLPQRRAMFLIQQIQQWIGSDDDLDDEVHSLIAELFVHLAPIVQELSGSHWDLVFDIVESNLETATWDEDASLPALFHSVRLLGVLKDLAMANTALRETAKVRIDKSTELVRGLFVSRPTSTVRHKPRVVILEAMARLMRDLPPKLMTMDSSFDQLLRLLRDPSIAVQQSAFDLVCKIATKHVSDLVVEVELESEQAPELIELPQELVALLSAQIDADDDPSRASTFLLGWLSAFRFFDFGSPRIKASYIDQLRKLDLVENSLLPSLFVLLNLSDRTRPFDVTPWTVEEFHVELVDELNPTLLAVFAAHVYYRALQTVPSLIRAYWEALKNRQLSLAVSAFTVKNISPVLIANELAHLRDPDDPAAQTLRDNEDFTVKVLAGANEVKAVFVVDEQAMEIGIRLPVDYPLAPVEVKDVRKVGVTDAQWRAWMLAVQQVVTSQNGLIADALNLFKRNATLHFEGVEACAICYSVISVVDRTLPTKACKTCSNRFHSSCLYKWFQTSHGSSCPLCRSLF